jgi:hypothetical protein
MLPEGIPERVKVGSLPTRISVVCRDVEQWFNRTQCEFERVAPLTGVTGMHPLPLWFWSGGHAPRPATGKQKMPNREMEKIESKYDLWQWLRVTMALRKLKAEAKAKSEALATTIDAGLGIGPLVKSLEIIADDVIALTVQKNAMDADMDAELNRIRADVNRYIPEELLPKIDKSLN